MNFPGPVKTKTHHCDMIGARGTSEKNAMINQWRRALKLDGSHRSEEIIQWYALYLQSRQKETSVHELAIQRIEQGFQSSRKTPLYKLVCLLSDSSEQSAVRHDETSKTNYRTL